MNTNLTRKHLSVSWRRNCVGPPRPQTQNPSLQPALRSTSLSTPNLQLALCQNQRLSTPSLQLALRQNQRLSTPSQGNLSTPSLALCQNQRNLSTPSLQIALRPSKQLSNPSPPNLQAALHPSHCRPRSLQFQLAPKVHRPNLLHHQCHHRQSHMR